MAVLFLLTLEGAIRRARTPEWKQTLRARQSLYCLQWFQVTVAQTVYATEGFRRLEADRAHEQLTAWETRRAHLTRRFGMDPAVLVPPGTDLQRVNWDDETFMTRAAHLRARSPPLQ